MTMVLAERTPTLDELVETINREHDACERSARDTITHAIAAGEGLLAARQRVEPHGWHAWIAENCPSLDRSKVAAYMRLAHYKNEIPSDARSWSTAIQMLTGLPQINPAGRNSIFGEAIRAEARRLRAEGLSYQQIADRLDVEVSGFTVRSWVDGGRNDRQKAESDKRRQARRKAEREALRRLERDRAMRKLGGPVAESYARLRRTAQALDYAISEVDDLHARKHLNDALSKLHAAEDAIVRALRLT